MSGTPESQAAVNSMVAQILVTAQAQNGQQMTPAQQAAMTTALRNAALAQAAQGNGVGHGRLVGANDADAVKCDLFRSARHVRAVLLLMVTLILAIAAVATPQ